MKRTQSILDQFDLHPGQWLILRDIAGTSPTTLFTSLNVALLRNPLHVKLLKFYLIELLIVEPSKEDKREKLLSL